MINPILAVNSGRLARACRARLLVVVLLGMAASARPSDKVKSMTMPEALEVALAQNPGLRAAQAQNQAAESRVREAKSGYLPQLAFTAGYTRYQEPNIVVPIHRTGVFPPLDNDIYEGITSLKVPLFNGGRTRAAHRTAGAFASETRAIEELTGLQLLEGIAQIYIQSQELQDKKTLVLARLNTLYRRYDELRTLLREGRISSADLALVTSAIGTSRSDSLEIEAKVYELFVRLGQVVGADGPIQPVISSPSQSQFEGLQEKVGLPDSGKIVADYRGLELRRAQAHLERAEAQYAQAARAFWPEISGFASYILRAGDDLDQTGEWAAGISLRLPLFEGGRRLAAKSAAKSSLAAADEQLRSVWQNQTAGLRIAYEQWRISGERRWHLAEAVENKSRSVSAYKLIYDAGRVTLSELLTQETELLRMQMDERSMAYGELLAMLRYHATAGTLTADLARMIVRNVP